MASATPPDTPGPVKLHCADALTAEFTPAEQMERAKVVMQASQRMPAVGFFGARYGERWHVDVVALPHNAVRRQLYDAFVMANAIGKMTLDVPEADLSRVYAWLGSLERFVEATLYAEQRFLYPVVDNCVRKKRAKLPEMLTPAGRLSAKNQILELLSAARKTRDVSLGETTAKINALRYALDQFGANILDYYGAMEKFLPAFFKTHLARKGERIKEKIEKQMIEQMLNEPQGVQLVALLMQCIESRTKRSQFLVRHFKKEKAREAFKTDVKQIQATHMQLARTFDTTATKYERVFSVNTFLQHYGSNVNNEETLQLLGDLDLNDEGDLTLIAPPDAPTTLLKASDPALEADISEDYIIVQTGVETDMGTAEIPGADIRGVELPGFDLPGDPPVVETDMDSAAMPDNNIPSVELPGFDLPPPFPDMPEEYGYVEHNHDDQAGSVRSYEVLDDDDDFVEVAYTYGHADEETPGHGPPRS